MYILKYQTHFDSAHSISCAYDKKCHNLHGHRWVVNITAEVRTLKNNMVIDFKRIKEVIDEYDHKNLNEIIKEEPTAENLARIIWEDVAKIFNQQQVSFNSIRNLSVEIFENPNASITYNGEE